MEELINRIEMDIQINKKCLQEETTKYLQNILQTWIKYDEELLAIIRRIQYEKTI